MTTKLPAAIQTSTVIKTISLTTGSETIGKNVLGNEVDNFYNASGILVEQDQHLTASLLVKYFLNTDGSYSEQMFSNGSNIAQINMIFNSAGLEQSQTLYSATGSAIITDSYTYNANKQMLTDVKTTSGIVDNISYLYSGSTLASMTHTNKTGFVTEIDTFTNGVNHAVYYYQTPAIIPNLPPVTAPVITPTVITTPTVTIPPMIQVATPATWSNIAGYGEVNFLKALDLATKTTIPVVASTNVDWSVSTTQANSVEAAGYTGKGIVIADIDTGIDLTNKALTGNLSQYDWNFITNNNNVQDDNGHGSFTAGEMIATSANGIVGASTGAQLMVLKAMGANGSGTVANVVSAIDYAVDHGANVINMSLGSTVAAPTILSALAYANSHGVLVSVASGNNLGYTPEYPAIYAKQLPNVMAVGASALLATPGNPLTYNDISNEAGSNNAYNYVVAPGQALKGYNQSGQIVTESGTSMASALVASEMADLMQAYNGIPHTASLDSLVMNAITGTSSPITIVGLQPIPASALIA